MRSTWTRWPIFDTLRLLWPFVAPERRRLAAALAVTTALTVVEIAAPVLVGLVVDGLLSGIAAGGSVLASDRERALLAALLVAAPLRGVLLARQRALEGELGQWVTARIRKRVWVQLQRLPVSYADRRGPGRLILRFVGDARAIQRMVGPGLVRLSQDVLVATGILVALALLNWRMSLAVLPLIPIQAAIFLYLNPRLRKESRARRRRRSRLSAYVSGRAGSLALAKASLAKPAEMDRFNAANRGIAARGTKLAATGGTILGLSATAVALSAVGVLLIAVGEAGAGRLTAGTFVTYYALLGLLTPIFERVAIANRSFQEGRISLDRITQTLAEAPEVATDGAPELAVGDGVVAVAGLTFRFGDGALVLEGVDLVARRGEIVALTGPNGSGKTTLLELLLRFREPTAGRIVIDGQDIAAVHPDSLRAQVGYVPQRPPLFDGSLAENVTIAAVDDLDPAAFERAVALAGADAIADRLPDGWDTQVAEGRRGLSQGERARLALARALLTDPPILLLDEPAAALDEEAERALAERLRDLARTRTVIVAGDRLPGGLVADRVYRLDGGCVTEAAGTQSKHPSDTEVALAGSR
jgi:subfamily B ATP-binding cassette protein MsbA